MKHHPVLHIPSDQKKLVPLQPTYIGGRHTALRMMIQCPASLEKGVLSQAGQRPTDHMQACP